MISVLRDHGHCVGFLRSAGPRGFTAYDADGQPLGLFAEKQAANRSDYGPKFNRRLICQNTKLSARLMNH
jgi:hypothetical protein